jgi:teichuronic acid biosynthesis glycosyltransferase TuaG
MMRASGMMDTSISVIIPTWNRAHTIEAAICSVLQQTLPVREVLICDDGSSDDTQQRVEAIAARDPRVIWLPGPRGGRPAIPRNRGIIAARGDWIAFLDSDDTWLPGKLERQMAEVEAQKVDAVCCNTWRVVPGSEARTLLLPDTDLRLNAHDLMRRNLVQCSSVLLRRRLFEQALGFPESASLKVGEDYALWLRIAAQTDFAYIAEPLMIYRDDAANSVRADSLDGWSERLAVFGDFSAWASSREMISTVLLLRARVEMLRAIVRRPLSRALAFCKRSISSPVR